MTDTSSFASKPQFDIGRVINRTFSAIKNNFVSFFLASLIVMGLPMFVIGLLPIFLGMDGMMNGNTLNEGYFAGLITISIVSFIVVLIGSVVLQGALIFGAVEDFNGRKASLNECLSVALRFFLPLLGLGLLVSLGVMLGFILLIIPGVLIALGWAIAAPVLIIEGKGVTDSISRSWELTQGYKRWILLLSIIFILISSVIGAILGVLLVAFGDPTTVMLEGASTTYHFMNALLSAVSQTITTMISATGVAAIYYEIRQIREGVGAENLAAVFD